MTIEDQGAWGDLIGGIAVVAGLIFVGIQLKVSNRETRLKAGQVYSDSLLNLSVKLAENSDLAQIYIRGLVDIDDLEEIDRMTFVFFVGNGVIRAFEGAHTSYYDGALNRNVWDNQQVAIQQFFGYKGILQVWGIRKVAFEKNFQSYVDDCELRIGIFCICMF